MTEYHQILGECHVYSFDTPGRLPWRWYDSDTTDQIHTNAMGDIEGTWESARGIRRIYVTIRLGSGDILLSRLKLGNKKNTLFFVIGRYTGKPCRLQ